MVVNLYSALTCLIVLSACVGKDDSAGSNPGGDDSSDSVDIHETQDSETGGCTDTGSTADIVAPVEGAVFVVGDTVALEGVFGGTGDGSVVAWSVDGVLVGADLTDSWVAEVGPHTVTLDVSGVCGSASASVAIDVLESAVTVFGGDLGLAGLSWHGLSAAPDGTLWATASVGLIHLDATVADAPTSRVYTTADGLYKAVPYGILAHSDGTIWVGDVGDVDRQGSHFAVESDGALTLLSTIDYTESTEIQYALRLREQPYGVGAGDVWMGTNEGACLYDADLGVFSEHAHPVHPHSLSYGIAFTPDGSIWNGDQYQISRWEYSNDGNLSPAAMSSGGDLAEYWVPWPVGLEEPIALNDIDIAPGSWTLWLASNLYGIARIDVGADVGTSVTTLLGEPFPATAYAIRDDGDGHVWIGTSTGLLLWDTATETMTDLSAWLPYANVTQLTVDNATTPPTVWAATPQGIVRFSRVP